jgi:hypothetical protein
MTKVGLEGRGTRVKGREGNQKRGHATGQRVTARGMSIPVIPASGVRVLDEWQKVYPDPYLSIPHPQPVRLPRRGTLGNQCPVPGLFGPVVQPRYMDRRIAREDLPRASLGFGRHLSSGYCAMCRVVGFKLELQMPSRMSRDRIARLGAPSCPMSRARKEDSDAYLPGHGDRCEVCEVCENICVIELKTSGDKYVR